MNAVERLGSGACSDWPVALSVLAYGVDVSVRLNDPRFADALLDHLPPGSKTRPLSETARTYSVVVEEVLADEDSRAEPCASLYRNRSAIARRSSLSAILRALEGDLQLHIAEMAPDRVFVHAAVVGWKGPGRSFSGKTTMVRELVRAGAVYYSDEYAVLDASGLVYPYPRPPAVRQPGWPGVMRTTMRDLGAPVGIGPLAVGTVVMTRFRPDAMWHPRRLSPGQGGLALLANTVSARRNPATVLATIERVVAGAPVFESDRAEAFTVVEPVLGLAAQHQSDQETVGGA
jgi:hypothetical protein